MIVIAIPARNEEATIAKCLDSVQASLRHDGLHADIVVCANNCTDNTAGVVRAYISQKELTNVSLIETDQGGLIRSQRLIVSRFYADIYVFVDADTYVAIDSIGKLIHGLTDGVVLTYASTRLPAITSKDNLVARIYHLYASGQLLTQRHYFHGRFFATREWRVPSDSKVSQLAQQAPELYQFGGLLVDDIYLSAYLLDKYGPGSIREIYDAVVFASPIQSLSDWWRTYRRTTIEVLKIVRWFPDFKSIQPYLYRTTNWKQWQQVSASAKFQWLMYLTMKYTFNIFVELELLSIRHFGLKPKEQWLRVNSTKQLREKRSKLVFFDLDETLVSNKNHYYENPALQKIVSDIIADGSIVGINTNRIFSGAIDIYQALNLNGPLVTEGGALAFVINNHGEFDEFIPNKRRKSDLQDRVRIALQTYLDKLDAPHGLFDKSEGEVVLLKEGVSVVISNDRQFTLSLYSYENRTLSEELSGRILEYLNNKLGKRGVIVERGPISGKLHIFYPDFNKVSTASILRDKYFPGRPIFLIGDDEANEGKRPAETYYLGVRQSAEQYRMVCTYVATRSGVEGLKQLLNYIEAS